MLPDNWNSVAARAWRTSPSARRMPAAAPATVGLSSCARRIAAANVTRITGTGGAAGVTICATAMAGLKACATNSSVAHM